MATEADQNFVNGKISTSKIEVRPGLGRKLTMQVKHRLPFCL